MTAIARRRLAMPCNSIWTHREYTAHPRIFQLVKISSVGALVPDLFWHIFLPLLQTMFQTPSCFIMKTWIADKVKAVKQNKQLWLSSSNIVMLAWKCLALTMPFLLFETWIGSEEQKHNEDNSVHLSYRHKSIVSAFCIHQCKGLIGSPYYRAYPHPTAVTRIILPRRNQLKKSLQVHTSE